MAWRKHAKVGECAEMLQTFGPCAFEDVGTLQDGSPSSEIQKEALSPADLTKSCIFLQIQKSYSSHTEQGLYV